MKMFLLSFVLVLTLLDGISQTPCASSFDVRNNGGGGSCNSTFPGNGDATGNIAYERDGLVQIAFENMVGTNVNPIITAIRVITSPLGEPVTTGANVDMKFVLKGFIGSGRTRAEYCFYSQSNLNLNNASGSRYQIDVLFTSPSGTTTSVCNISQRSDLVTLPATFGAFVARRKSSSSVLLKWSTLAEQNNKGFYVQRNTGNGWMDAGFVFSQTVNGNSSTGFTYEFKDVNAENATTQYRLLQMDNNGFGKYSNVIAVSGDVNSGKVVVYPNPSTNGKVNIAFENNHERDVTVYDISGRIVKRLGKINSSHVEIDGLTSGVYTIQMIDGITNELTREKLVVNPK